MRPTTLKKARADAGLTQSELAEKAGVSRSAIAKLEAGRTMMARQGTMKLLAKALGRDSHSLAVPRRGQIRADGAGRQDSLESGVSSSRRSDRTRAIEQSGIATRLSDGTYRIWLDEYVCEQVQVELLGETHSVLTPKPIKRGLFRAPNGASNCLHVRAIDEDLLYTIAVEADEPPFLTQATDRGLVLQNDWFEPDGHSTDDGVWYQQLTLMPWHQILSIGFMVQRRNQDRRLGDPAAKNPI